MMKNWVGVKMNGAQLAVTKLNLGSRERKKRQRYQVLWVVGSGRSSSEIGM